MRHTLLKLALVLGCCLAPLEAWATCNLAMPLSPENDCDNDGYTIGMGDCNDNPANGGAPIHPGATEVCDGVDNNCANGVDEGNPGGGVACSTGQLGVCGPGTTACTAGAIVCNRTTGPSAETCDNLDNDCNGVVDNGVTRRCYDGPGGTDNVGVCHGVTQTCVAGAFPTAACAGAPGQVLPGAEVCDNQDNNCNGMTDEGNPGGGAACSTGQLGVCAAGTQTCQAGALACVRTVGPSAEVCDNLDNDCNGVIDNGVTRVCFAGPAGTFNGTCPGPSCAPKAICMGVTQACSAGAFPTCDAATPGQVLPTAEICDNKDNNCNGTVDEGNPGGGAGCSTGQLGVCAAGTQTCQAGALACVRNVGPSAEICDNLDNNCDGTIDNGVTRTCYGGPAGTFTGTCPPPGTTAVGNCAPRGACTGVSQTCVAGAFPVCAAGTVTQGPVAEVCDNVDNDCDGTLNNGNPGGGAACSTGQLGVCSAGTLTCQGAPGMLNCVRNVGPTAEVCDNLDNNCNGQVDENVNRICYTGPAGSYTGTCPPVGNTTGNCQPRGICMGVNQTCTAGAFPVCDATVMPQVFPQQEICNTLDDNCDGILNNGVTGAGAACTTGLPGRCSAGTQSCNAAGMIVCTQDAGPINELCNGIDDNCNGFVDERAGNNTAKMQQSCYPFDAGAPGNGLCTAGNQDCTAAAGAGVASWGMCIGAVGPSTEVCNGLQKDENCNGVTDEGFDLDNDGFKDCARCAGLAVCDCNDNDPTIHPGATELCDTIDQDCDGNPFNVLPRKCFVGANVTPAAYTGTCPGPTCQPKGVCLAGIQMCGPGGVFGSCDGQVLPASSPDSGEVIGLDGGSACNGVDDNCNGVIDDGEFDRDHDGVKTCEGDCNDDPDGGAAIHPGALEQCNGYDDNCDGVIDGVSTSCYTGDLLPDGGFAGLGPDGGSTLNVGICRAGTATCVNGVPTGACLGQTTPGLEQCNLKDDNCNGQVDEDFDLDHDGLASCALCPGLTPCDCNDDPNGGQFVRPGLPEVCDCADNNCDGQVDEGAVCKGAPCHDFDFDGITNCQGDCNDNNALINPRATEIVGNGVDDDCDGAIDEDTDEDGDGYTTGMGDCDDHAREINPGAVERCDGFDNNCNGQVDEGFDQDHDFATTCAGDCDDNDPTKSPFLREVCGNGKDDNCDGRTDEDTDEDLDGVTTCQGDCNDHNPNVHGAANGIAAALEVCDGEDNDCNGMTDEGFDQDNDRVPVCYGDCNDHDPNVGPNMYEVPGNGIDDNCNGQIDEGAEDKDHDGFTGFCGDCNDSDPSINPHAKEVCDRVDNNCDGYVDSAPGQYNLCATCFDADGDGQTNCDGDCNDADKTIYRGAPEICDGKDNDCEGSIDLDPNGFRVCVGDAGFDDGGTADDGGQGGGQGGGAGGDGPNGPTDRPVVTTGCGCGSGGTSAPVALMMAAMLLLWRRRSSAALVRVKARAPLTTVAVVSALTLGCPSSLHHPDPAVVDAGDDDAGVDAGYKPPVEHWDCGDLYPSEIIKLSVGGTGYPFGVPPRFARAEVAAAQAWVLDDGPADVAAFVLRRSVPSDVTAQDGGLTDPLAVTQVAVREIAALNGLAGTPLVRERTERFSRVFVGPTYTSSQTLLFATASNAFSVRNRLLASFSGKTPAELGALPVVAGARAEDTMVVNVMFRIKADNLFVSVAVTPASRFRENQPIVTDITNGSHLGDLNAELQFACEHRVAPALKSDFIFVVDDSGSMIEEQAALAAASESLYNAFAASGLDFRLGVVTTDGEVLRGKGFTRDLAQFQSDVRVGINGNGDEEGLEYGLRAIHRARDPLVLEPSGFCPAADPTCFHLRDDAGLVVVFLSDEEAVNLKPVAQYALDYQNEKAVAFAIVGPRPIGCTKVGLGRANAGTSYIDVATATGGSSGSICNPNLLEIVEEVVIGALGAASRSPLAQRPISGSLAVRTTEVVARSRVKGFDYDPAGNTVLFFGSVPAEGSMFDVAYSYFGIIQ